MLRYIDLLLVTFICSLFFSPKVYSQTWTTTTVGSVSSSTMPIIFADPLGNLHVAWTSSYKYLQYATNQSGSWGFSTQVASNSEKAIIFPSITSDEYGFAYVVGRFEQDGSLGLYVAASWLYKNGRYQIKDRAQPYNRDELIKQLVQWQ